MQPEPTPFHFDPFDEATRRDPHPTYALARREHPAYRHAGIPNELVGAALDARSVDLVQALTYPPPVIVIAEIIGVPAEDREQFKGWSDALVANLGLGLLTPPTRERLDRQLAIM